MLGPRKPASPFRSFNSLPEIVRLVVMMYLRQSETSCGRTDRSATVTNGSQRRLYYDGYDLALEYSGTGTLLRRFVHGPSAGDDALLWYEGSTVSNSTRRHLHADRLGSIVAVTDYQGMPFLPYRFAA